MKKIFSLFIILAMLLTAVPLTASAEEKDDYIKILLIGNSYSDDAADGGYFLQDAYCQSMLYKIIKSMVGDGCKVDIGLCWSGGVSLGWHATKAKSGAAEYTFLNISDDTNGRWQILGSSDVSSKYALEYTDWDVVVLQPYGQEVKSKTGKSSESAVTAAYRQLSGSVPYMLDYVAEHAPGAEVYLYQIFVMYSTPVDVLTKTAKEFGYIQANTIAAESCTGTNSGKKIAGIIPVGTAVQNARSTYLNDLWNGAEAIANSTIDPIYDPMEGLLRDRCHLTFNVGRYIANLTFAEKLIPEEMRADGCELPDMRPSEVVGELPREYVDVAKACVDAAIESEKATSGRLNAVTIGKYAAPFSDETLAALDGVEVKASGVHTPAELRAAVKKAYEDILGERITVNFTDEDAIEAFSFSDSDGKAELTVPTTVRYGYSEIAADVSVSLSCPHTDVETAEAVAPTCISTGHGAYEKCTVCGTLLSGSDEILPMTDHTPGEAATCTEPQICTFCKAELAPAKGHVPGEAATCTEPQICTVCKTELVPAKGHKVG
ncbi:MAG: DUF4886 domain-containing protein, partial [Clostridia bacterium]|nr:DUF4886 domain-containing protein [Clostridia bacterium]